MAIIIIIIVSRKWENILNNKKILVTGGSGFIGKSLVERLVTYGYSPIVFDNDSRGSMEKLKHLNKKVEFFEGDIRNKEDVLTATKNCSGLIHLAFVNGTRFFYEKPELVLEVGVKGAINTLDVALELGLKKYMLASSSEVYQQPSSIPTDEKERIIIPDITNPRFSYSGGKIISELLAINYLRNSKIDHAIFRPHNVFGPQMGFEHVIPEIVKKIHVATDGFKKNSCSIEIQGSGNETRAFCYVEDAVDQIMLVFEHGKNGEIYHIGMNKEVAILDLIKEISNLLCVDVNIVPGSLPSGGTSRRCPDIRKICGLGYDKKNNFDEGMKKTVKWYKAYYLNQN